RVAEEKRASDLDLLLEAVGDAADDDGAHREGLSCRGVERASLSRFGLVLLVLVTLGWGVNWPILKIVLAEVPPLTFRGACLVVGGAGVLVLARLAGLSLAIPRSMWARLLALAAGNIVGWNVFVIYGVALVPSGRAALLAYTMPLWSTLLSAWLLGERLNARRAVALALGMAGVAALLGGDALRMSASLTGPALLIGAAVSWAAGVVLLKRYALPVPTVTLTGWMMLVGAVPIVAAAIPLEHAAWQPIGTAAALGLVYNIVVSFMFCYWAWNRLVLMVPVSVSSISSLATPVVGVASGMALLGEPLTWNEVAAAVSILGAIALVITGRR